MFCTRVAKDFYSESRGAICFCEWENRLLMLKRSPQSYEGNRWTAAPGGKIEPGETPLQAALREVFEETGIRLPHAEHRMQLYFNFSDDFAYGLHIFYAKLTEEPRITIDPKEHLEWRWATLSEAYQMPLMRGGKECLDQVFGPV